MLDKLTCLSRSSWYWLGLILLGVGMEAVALFYQYGLEYSPCVLCIQVRIWVLALILVGFFGLIIRKSPGLGKFSHLLTLGVSIGFAERSWRTLAVERGWIIDTCSLDSGLPDWFALDKWFPVVFKPWEPCGYTPELLFGITMAEGLMFFSVIFCCCSALFFLLQLRHR